ncbi:glycosyltransferase family 4 protein [Clostridium sp. C8-1-8]|uniref:glycosyltransferase family 4 protein n=1 Tax=Clostridium sp. C8-1-8 TaxID=2698831 RepID=UPI00136B0915|nr:glycosyltransferase family 4 protein [Clostridium sp. C8-1-8]
MKRSLLVYAHYFYPDVASTGQILTELTEGLEEYFDLTVICAVPSYGGTVDPEYKSKRFYFERLEKLKVIRVRVPEFSKINKISRIKNIIVYFLNSLLATLKIGKQDYVFTISQPPILGGLLGVIGSKLKKAKLIYNIQDFNPEQVEAVGYSKSQVLLGIARAIDKYSCKKSSKIILVGRDMKDTLSKRFEKGIPTKVSIINNWINEKEIFPISQDTPEVKAFKERYKLFNKLVIMYSGNIGLYYDLENIIKVIGRFKDERDVAFAFVGEGAVKKKLVEYVSSNNINNVIFIPYQDKDKLNFSLNAGDIHWVVNAKGIKGVSVPSKLYGVMAAGKAVIGVLEKGSEARLIIEESQCGICVEPGDYEGLYKVVKDIITNSDVIKKRGINGREYLEKNLTKEKSIVKYKKAILET